MPQLPPSSRPSRWVFGRPHRLLDALTLTAINRFSKTTLPERPTLFFEFHGSQSSVAEQAEFVQQIAGENGGENSNGRPARRTARASGRHGTTPTSPACR